MSALEKFDGQVAWAVVYAADNPARGVKRGGVLIEMAQRQDGKIEQRYAIFKDAASAIAFAAFIERTYSSLPVTLAMIYLPAVNLP